MGNSSSTPSPSEPTADSRAIVLNEIFSQQISLVIIDYLNPLYAFQDGLFEMKATYNDKQYWDIWEIYLTIDNQKQDNIFQYDNTTKSIQTTAQLLFITHNKQDFGPMLVLDKHLCTINISSIYVPTIWVENNLNLSEQFAERKKDGKKWNKQELNDKTHCIEIRFDPVVINLLHKDKLKAVHVKYIRKTIVIPACSFT